MTDKNTEIQRGENTAVPEPHIKGGTAEDRRLLREAIDKWPPMTRRIVDAAGITFKVGKHILALQDYDPAQKSVNVHADLIKRENYIEGNLALDALLCVCEEKMGPINWKRASDEFIAFSQKTPHPVHREFMDAGSLMVNANRNLDSDNANRDFFKRECPYIVEVYDKLQAVTTAKISGHSVDINTSSLTSTPAVEAVYNLYMDAARKEALQYKFLGGTPRLEASDTAFAIDTAALTAPQQKYFEHLNEVVKLLGVTPKEFDDQFRIAAAQQAHVSSCDAAEKFLNLSNTTFKGKLHVPNVTERISQIKGKLGLHDEDVQLSVQGLEGIPWKRLAEEQNIDSITRFHEVAPVAVIELLDRYLGVYHLNAAKIGTTRKEFGKNHRHKIQAIALGLTSPEAIRSHEQEIEMRRAANVPQSEHLMEALSAEINVLQSYATVGNRPLHSLKSIVPAISYGGGIHAHPDTVKGAHPQFTGGGVCVMPSVADYFQAAVHNAVLHITREKEIERLAPDSYSAIKARLQAMDDLWPQAIMTPVELAAARRAAHLESEKQRKPYKFPEGSAAARHALENSNFFIKEIKPIADTLSIDINEHRLLGRSLFSDPVLAVAEAMMAKDVSRLEALMDPVQHPETLDALIIARSDVNDALTASPDDVLPTWQAHHHKALHKALKGPRLLLSALNGDVAKMLAEAKKPEPYQPAEGSAAAKFIKQYAKDPDPKTMKAGIGREEVEGRALLWQEIAPFIGKNGSKTLLNAKAAEDKALGDALLGDAIIKLAVYAVIPASKKLEEKDVNKLFANSEVNTQAVRDALRDILQAETHASEERRLLAEHLRQHCPTLLVCATGDRRMIEEYRLTPAKRDALVKDALTKIAPPPVIAPKAGVTPPAESIPAGVVSSPVAEVPPADAPSPPTPLAPASGHEKPAGTVDIITPVAAVAAGAVAATIATPSAPAKETDSSASPPEAKEPEGKAVKPSHELPAPVFDTPYERLRYEERQKRDYAEAEVAALASARLLADHWVKQEECTELDCQLRRSGSHYEIWLTFGRDGKGVPPTRISLQGVRHIDDAIDIYFKLENVIYDEYGLNTPLAAFDNGKSVKLRKPPVEVTYLGANDPVPQLVVNLDSTQIPLDANPEPHNEPKKKKGASVEAEVIDVRKAAILVVHSWYTSMRGGRHKRTQMNIPLGAKFEDTQEVEARKQYAVDFMKTLARDAKKQDVIDELKEEFRTRQGKDWFEPKGIPIDGYETARILEFPLPDYNQQTRLSAAYITSKRLEGAITHYAQFGVDVRDLNPRPDGSVDQEWHNAYDRAINLHTADPELAKVRAREVMDNVVAMFNHTLNEGSGNPPLPDGHYWELGKPDADGKRKVVESFQSEDKNHKPWMEPWLDKRKINVLTDYYANPYLQEDFAVRLVNPEHEGNSTRFTLQLVRATRGEKGGERLPGEVMRMDHSSKKDETVAIEIPFMLTDENDAPAERLRRIKNFEHAVDASLKLAVSKDYKAFIIKTQTAIKPTGEYRTVSVVNNFIDAVRSHREHDFYDMGIVRDALHGDIEQRLGKHRASVSRRRPEPPARLPHELGQDSTLGGWAERENPSFRIPGNGRWH